MRPAKLIVVSHQAVYSPGEYTGYSWGVLMWNDNFGISKIFLSNPNKRKNIRNLPLIDGSFLDTFNNTKKNIRLSSNFDLALFERLKSSVILASIPECLFDVNGDIEFPGDISNYLRAHASPESNDSSTGGREYEIPDNIGEMLYDPYEFDETEIVV